MASWVICPAFVWPSGPCIAWFATDTALLAIAANNENKTSNKQDLKNYYHDNDEEATHI